MILGEQEGYSYAEGLIDGLGVVGAVWRTGVAGGGGMACSCVSVVPSLGP